MRFRSTLKKMLSNLRDHRKDPKTELRRLSTNNCAEVGEQSVSRVKKFC